jgi:succinyl-diaminopimelate desuccinylase
MIVNLNHRFPPGRTVEQAIAGLRARVPDAFGFEVVDQAPPGEVCLDHPEVKRLLETSGAKVGAKQGWTDVARFTAAGVPAFNYGPGIPDLCHRADESCPIANLGVVYENLARFLSEGAA